MLYVICLFPLLQKKAFSLSLPSFLPFCLNVSVCLSFCLSVCLSFFVCFCFSVLVSLGSPGCPETQRSACLWQWVLGLKGMCHHCQQPVSFLRHGTALPLPLISKGRGTQALIAGPNRRWVREWCGWYWLQGIELYLHAKSMTSS